MHEAGWHLADPEEAKEARELFEKLKEAKPEPHLNLVPSVEFQGKRFRAVGSRLHFRDTKETYHEFLIRHLQAALGPEWWERNRTRTGQSQHVVLRWLNDYRRWTAAHKNEAHQIADGIWSAPNNGDTQALLSLAYDLLCLTHTGKLPDDLLARLRHHEQFQGARYEVAVAAIFERAGYDIIFTEDVPQQPRCEFIATQRGTGVQIAVEAKSRHRSGVLNQKGIPDFSPESLGSIRKLFRDACGKKPGMPFMIFIDVNLPPSPDVPTDELVWLPDVRAVIEASRASPEHPTVYNHVVITNFAHYYAGEDISSGRSEFMMIDSLVPAFPLASVEYRDALENSIRRYSSIPTEV